MASKQTQQRKARERFNTASRIEREYTLQLRTLTEYIDHIVRVGINVNMTEQELNSARYLVEAMLTQYSDALKPWAIQTAERIVMRIHKVDENEWIQIGRQMGRALRKELQDAPTGLVTRSFMAENVKLITSLPLDAAQRVHETTLNGITEGTRASEIASKILETGNVTKARATLIARTEVARTATGLTRARAMHIGSEAYYWRTSADGSVRESHKSMNGRIIRWDTEPEVEPGKHYHAGCFPNCRCYAEPILDDI